MKDGIVTLTYGKVAHLDATTGPTDWAGRSIELERKMGMEGHAPAPPHESRRPGQIETTCEIDATTGATVDAATGATSDSTPFATTEATPDAHVDATTGATVDATTGATRLANDNSTRDASAKAGNTSLENEGWEADVVDAATGATPGVSAACKELGMASLSDVIADMGIKPPGQA